MGQLGIITKQQSEAMFYNGQVYEPCLFETIKLQRLLIGMAYTPCYKLLILCGKH
jgi:hypothetical protein